MKYDLLSDSGKVMFTGTLEEIAQWECDNLIVTRTERIETVPDNGYFKSNLRPHKENYASSD